MVGRMVCRFVGMSYDRLVSRMFGRRAFRFVDRLVVGGILCRLYGRIKYRFVNRFMVGL